MTANIAPTSAIQNLNFPAGLTGGVFTLTFTPPTGSASTSLPITYSAITTSLASNIQSALNSIGVTTALATVTATSPTNVNVTFQGADSGGVITASNGLTAASGLAINQKQTISFTGITGGIFELVWSSGPGATATTTPITFSTSSSTLASNISNALNNLSTIGSGNVSVSVSSNVATITFQGALAGIPQTNLFTVIGAATPTIQNIAFAGTPIGGVFSLSFVTPAGTTSTSSAVTYSTNTATLAANIQAALNTIDSSVNAVESRALTGSPQGGFYSPWGLAHRQPAASVIAATRLERWPLTIQAALNNLSTIGSGNVSVTASSASSVSITFQNALGFQNITTPIVANAAGLTGGTSPAITVNPTASLGFATAAVSAVSATSVNVTFQNTDGGGVIQLANALGGTGTPANAVQTLTFPAAATSGTFTLTFSGATTGPIGYSTSLTALASSIQAALNGLSTITAGAVTVGPVSGTTVSVTFGGAMGGKVQSAISGNGVTVNAAYTVNFTGSPTSGQFQLTFDGSSTGTINYSTNPGTLQANIQNKLDALATIGAGNTLAIVNAAASSAVITFQNSLAGTPESPITATGTLSPGGVSVTPSTTNGFVGLSGATTQTITDASITVGFAGLSGTGGGLINVTFTQAGFGLAGAASPTTSALVANTGLLGLVGGANGQTITLSSTQIGSGLTGTSPSVNVFTVNPG